MPKFPMEGIATSHEAVAATTAHTFGGGCIGIVCTAAGTLVGQMEKDSANVSSTVVAGLVIPGQWKSLDDTNGVAVIALYRH